MKERMRTLMYRVETRIIQHKANRGTKRAEKLHNDIHRYFVKYADIVLAKCGNDPFMKAMAVRTLRDEGIMEQTETQDDTQDVFDI